MQQSTLLVVTLFLLNLLEVSLLVAMAADTVGGRVEDLCQLAGRLHGLAEQAQGPGTVILSRFVGLFLLNLPCADKDDTV